MSTRRESTLCRERHVLSANGACGAMGFLKAVKQRRKGGERAEQRNVATYPWRGKERKDRALE